MSIFFKARSGRFSYSFGILLIRLSLGSLFLFSGASKVIHLQEFIQSVQATGMTGSTLSFILAFILPFLELIFGALYIIGLFTPLTSFAIACMTISFMIVLGVRHEELPFTYNFIFLACSVATLFTGAGLFSFDAMIDRSKKPVVTIKTEAPSTGSSSDTNHEEPDVIFVEKEDVKDSKEPIH